MSLLGGVRFDHRRVHLVITRIRRDPHKTGRREVKRMAEFIYKGAKTKEISFPLGGIGSGCIGLAGNGRLIDWEIFNRPNKGSTNGFSHFAIKAEAGNRVLDAKVLNGDLQPPYTGQLHKPAFQSFGFGPSRSTMAGAPHFREVEFQGEYPIARLRFKEEKFPGKVTMTAFNPYIPLNDKDSSIPGAFFEIEVTNTTDQQITYTICLNIQNPLPASVNTFSQDNGISYIHLTSEKFESDAPEYGDISIATDAADVSYQEYWFRGAWFDNLSIYWRDLTTPGRFKNRSYDNAGVHDHGLLGAHLAVEPRSTHRVRFIITWNFPNCYNYWHPEPDDCNDGSSCGGGRKPTSWKNYYATIFADSTDSALYSMQNWDRLYADTLLFKEALFSSTIPSFALDAISANLCVLKTPTVLRLEDGSFYGFEGCNPGSGCCEGSCTHVWNYTYVLPFLFPQLERSMRDLDFKYNQREDGKMSFRLQLPLGRERSAFRACADGQFGGVIKTYRDWKISGDSKWMEKHWPAIEKSIEFAWAETNEDKWDLDKDGVLEGRQHHTLDMELFGPNSWLTGFYLAALKAAAEMAAFLGKTEKAEEYRALFTHGKKWVDEHLFNGEYYHQLIDVKDKSVLDPFVDNDPNVVGTYWNDEHKQLKYQIGEGCGIDQVHAQWQANICGLGEIFDPEQTKRALASIYKHNFKQMRDHFNPCRLYCLNDEAGLLICEWPENKEKPAIPLPYAEETQNGYEYQAAIHMVQEGLVDQGLDVIKAIRDRYDGEKRNPWNEFECGSNYARSMASFALLPALSGFEFDLVKGHIGFNPKRPLNGEYKCFWSLGTGWGIFEMKPGRIVIRVLYGQLELRTINLPFLESHAIDEIRLGESNIGFTRTLGQIELATPALIKPEGDLSISASQE